MKTNITLKLDAGLLREARVLAAEEDTSISAMLAARLEQIVRERKTYQRARKRALGRLREGMDLRWTPARSREIESLWMSGEGVLSTQVLQELCVNLRRKVAKPLPVDEIRGLIDDYLSWEIVVNSPQAVLQALEIEVRYKTSFWDALILQAAEQSGAAVLYSEDLAAQQSCGTVRVVNPLVG